MALASAQVVDAVAARITGLALSGNRIYTSRAWPIDEKTLRTVGPAGRVFAVDEDITPQTIHAPTRQQHALQIELEGLVREVENVDDEMHALAAQWLTALFSTTPPADALAALGAKVLLTQRRIEREMQSDGQASIGRVLITLRAEFHTRSNAPDTIV